MQLLNRSIATCQFEMRRAFTRQRFAVGTVLALFPPVMLFLMLAIARVSTSGFSIVEFLTVFLVSLVCILSLLLWATPNVYSEIEGKSWMFIASRPQGRIANVLGKYMASVIYSYIICLIAISLSAVVISMFERLQDPVRFWVSTNAVFFLGCLCFGAVFSLIGTLFYRRAMVIGAAYVIAFEVIVGRLPAIIGKMTASYHLQMLGLDWIGWFLGPEREKEVFYQTFGDHPQWVHLTSVAVITLFALGTACFVIVNREYVTADET